MKCTLDDKVISMETIEKNAHIYRNFTLNQKKIKS